MSRIVPFVLAGLAAASADAQEAARPDGAAGRSPEAGPVRAELVADADRVAPEGAFRVGVRFEVAPGWHIYWTYPGNSGQPTRVDLRSPDGSARLRAPRFPAPEVFDAERVEDMTFGYEGTVLVPVQAMAGEVPRSGQVRVEGVASWQACSRRTCLTGRRDLALTLPTGGSPLPSRWSKAFDEAQERLPEPAGEGSARLESVEYSGGRYRVSFALDGWKAVERFVPHWTPGGACSLVQTGIRPDGNRFHVEYTLSGPDCLRDAGGVAIGRLASEPEARPSRARWIRPDAPRPEIARDAAPAAAGSVAVVDRPADPSPAQAPASPGSSASLLQMLLFAFLGGLLLNVMPCVIPVVVPKILHVVRTATRAEDPAQRRRILWTNSLAYAAGVLATLTTLAVLVIVLKRLGHQVGWGFQFQNPWFLVFMVSLLVVLGLGMLHVFPLQGPDHVEDLRGLRRLRQRDSRLESFMTGLMVTFLGTPCTAPLLGPALGYAFTAGDVEILLLLAATGCGLSAPFLALGAWTGWAKYLPTKVTKGYDRIARGMAFLLFGTAVWLVTVIAGEWGAEAAGRVLWFVLLLCVGAWVAGLWIDAEGDSLARRAAKAAAVFAVALVAATVLLEFPATRTAEAAAVPAASSGIQWETFSRKRLGELRTTGRPLFVDFTAAWCMNCKANERLVIETEPVRALFDRGGVVAVRADLTQSDPEKEAWLRRFGRAGVPMYLVIPPCGGIEDATLLPEILTTDRIREALDQAGPRRDRCPPAS